MVCYRLGIALSKFVTGLASMSLPNDSSAVQPSHLSSDPLGSFSMLLVLADDVDDKSA